MPQVASINDHETPDLQVEPRSTGPRRYSAEYKARILAEYEALDRQGKGEAPEPPKLPTAAWINKPTDFQHDDQMIPAQR